MWIWLILFAGLPLLLGWMQYMLLSGRWLKPPSTTDSENSDDGQFPQHDADTTGAFDSAPLIQKQNPYHPYIASTRHENSPVGANRSTLVSSGRTPAENSPDTPSDGLWAASTGPWVNIDGTPMLNRQIDIEGKPYGVSNTASMSTAEEADMSDYAGSASGISPQSAQTEWDTTWDNDWDWDASPSGTDLWSSTNHWDDNSW